MVTTGLWSVVDHIKRRLATPCYTWWHYLLMWGMWRRMICTFNWLYNELMTVNGEHFPSSGRVDDVSKNAYEYSSTTIFILNNVNVALERVLSGCRATCFNISRCAGLGQTLRRHWWGLIWCKQWTLTPEWILQLLSLLQYHQTSHRQQHNSDPSEEEWYHHHSDHHHHHHWSSCVTLEKVSYDVIMFKLCIWWRFIKTTTTEYCVELIQIWSNIG